MTVEEKKNTYVGTWSLYSSKCFADCWTHKKDGEVVPKGQLIRVMVEEGRNKVRKKRECMQGKKNNLKKKRWEREIRKKGKRRENKNEKKR